MGERVVIPRDVKLFSSNGASIASLKRPEHMSRGLRLRILHTELGLAETVVGNDIKKQMAHNAFEVIDLFNKQEQRYSDWDFLLVNDRIEMIAMIRRGREHQRLRRHCKGTKEATQKYLSLLPQMLGEPEEIALAVDAANFNVEELNDLYRDNYMVDPSNRAMYVRAYVDYPMFRQIQIPYVEANISIERIDNKKILNRKTKEELRSFYRLIQGDAYSFKSRSLRTGHYWEAFDEMTKPSTRLGVGGIIAQDESNHIMPISLGGDLVVAKDARMRGIGTALRWLTYASVFSDEKYVNGIITSYFLKDPTNPAWKIVLDRFKAEPVSESLWVVLKKIHH